jgi:hypothetical protein
MSCNTGFLGQVFYIISFHRKRLLLIVSGFFYAVVQSFDVLGIKTGNISGCVWGIANAMYGSFDSA